MHYQVLHLCTVFYENLLDDCKLDEVVSSSSTGSMMGAWCDDISFSVLLLSSYATIAVWIIVLRRNCCLYIRYDDMQCITNIKF